MIRISTPQRANLRSKIMNAKSTFRNPAAFPSWEHQSSNAPPPMPSQSRARRASTYIYIHTLLFNILHKNILLIFQTYWRMDHQEPDSSGKRESCKQRGPLAAEQSCAANINCFESREAKDGRREVRGSSSEIGVHGGCIIMCQQWSFWVNFLLWLWPFSELLVFIICEFSCLDIIWSEKRRRWGFLFLFTFPGKGSAGHQSRDEYFHACPFSSCKSCLGDLHSEK